MTFNGWGVENRDTPVGSAEVARLLEPIYGHVIRSFGASKAMFESNFPVDKVCLSYRVLWNAFKRLSTTLGLSTEEMHALFYGTAARVYRLDVTDATSAPTKRQKTDEAGDSTSKLAPLACLRAASN
jgi:L-fuconolactonase